MMSKYLKMVEVFAKKVDIFFRSFLEVWRFVPGVIDVTVDVTLVVEDESRGQ